MLTVLVSTKKILDKSLSFFLITIFILLVVCVIWQVLARWMNISSLFTDESARYMFIWVGLFGAAYGHGQKRHLAIDILVSKLKGVPQLSLQVVIHLLVIGFALLVMFYGGGKLMMNTLQNGQITPTLKIPMWIIYLAIPTNGLLIALYSLYDLLMLFVSKDQDQHNISLNEIKGA